MSSPWAKLATPEPKNLEDIMSEEFAKELQAKENKKYVESAIPNIERIEIPAQSSSQDDPDQSDEVIARMLQKQFDEEYDDMLKRTEDKYNGTSKVSVSFSNYRRVPLNQDLESDSEEEEVEDLRDRKDWDRFDSVQREFNIMPPCGYRVKDGNIITKHDITMNGRRNACKLMSFPPEFETGDGAGFDLKLSNKVFNSLKIYSKHEQARRHRIHDKREDQATAEFGMDQATRLLVYKMINKGLLEQVNGVISIGKEAVILHASSDPNYECPLPKELVIKVFKTTLAEFKQRDKYIKNDYRFKERIGKQKTRNTIHLWAEKEMHNLVRLQKAGIPCPEVVALKSHILVMSFIGEDNQPAPKLKEADLSDAEFIVAYNQVVELMKVLFHEAKLIHADLSEYNILWHKGQCYFIDVSQSTEPGHDDAFVFLMRDCVNVTKFFDRKGVPEVKSAEELFEEITGCDFKNKIALLALQNSFKMKPHMSNNPTVETYYNFDSAWEQSLREKELIKKVNETVLVDPITG